MFSHFDHKRYLFFRYLYDFHKDNFKALVKSKVIDYWEKRLRSESEDKTSLSFFQPNFLSLKKPHPILTSCSSNPFEVNKALVQCKMLSGRYRSDWLCRYWSKTNKDGHCSLCLAPQGDLQHMLTSCSTLAPKRKELVTFWFNQSEEDQVLRKLLETKLSASCQELTQFLIDPSPDPDFIIGRQQNEFDLNQVFHLTRTFCYGIHRRKLQLCGLLNKM